MIPLDSELIGHGHEQVAWRQDPATGTLFIVAIHNSILGPALGGCRMHKYTSTEEALFDVLRLSEGMTFKNALAGLHLGGGKSVIVADRSLENGRVRLFESFGRFVQTLDGRYYTAEDVGTTVSDMSSVLHTCRFVAGRDPKVGGGGDPSPYTAFGVFHGIRACLERVFGSDDMKGKTIAVQGVGHVGRYLVERLIDAGAKVTIADKRKDVEEEVSKAFKVSVCSVEQMFEMECDVLAPCALGGVLNKDSAQKLKCKIVAGAANNQVLGEGVEDLLAKRGILYAPDFAINAGGVILCADELEPGGFTESRVLERVARIYQTVGKILDQAKSSGETPGAVAVRLARERIDRVRQKSGPK